MVLVKGPQGASLYVRGRDVEESEHAIAFNKDTCRWTILGEATEVRRSETRRKIVNELADAEDLTPDPSALRKQHNQPAAREDDEIGRGRGYRSRAISRSA